MKQLVIFILLFLTSNLAPVLACGPYYPERENIRMRIVSPDHLMEFAEDVDFSYTSTYFKATYLWEDSRGLNALLWRKQCDNVPDAVEIYGVLYRQDADINDKGAKNSFVKYLYENKKTDILAYLQFAYACEPYNSYGNPWEDEEEADRGSRQDYFETALSRAETTQDEILKLRYAFLALRLAFYLGRKDEVKRIYESYFSKRETKNILDYWAMAFYAYTLVQNSPEANFYAAQVFVNAKDKRLKMYYEIYSRDVDVEKTLALAKTAEEKTAIWLLEGLANPAKGLVYIKKIMEISAQSKDLNLLLMREINKLEDWIYTPYYTAFEATVAPLYWLQNPPDLSMEERLQKDRGYAQELLNFVNRVSIDNTDRPALWQIAKISLNMMVLDYKTASKELKRAKKWVKKGSRAQREIDKLNLLCNVSNKPIKGLKVFKDLESYLKEEYKDPRLTFAIGRTLEFQGNTTLAALIYSKINQNATYDNAVYWRTPEKRSRSWDQDYYSNYLQYIEMEYSPEAMQALINEIEKSPTDDSFLSWLFKDRKEDLAQLYNLLGTRYIQQNKLQQALACFEKVPADVWENYPYKDYMDANPFYTNLFLEHERTDADTIRYTKVSLTKTLIEYQQKAADENNPERDYYYFLLGTAYFNMTQYGNTWIMRRSFWSASAYSYGLEDDDEFFECLLSQQYFIKAAELAKVNEFKTICLAMAGRCRQYEIDRYETMKMRARWDDSIKFGEVPNEENPYYKILENTQAEDYEELRSNCYAFDRYVAARFK